MSEPTRMMKWFSSRALRRFRQGALLRRADQFRPLRNGLAPLPGFTLVETIVALAVIVAALIGPFTLATRGIFSASLARNKIIAANLAQEGIELVRAVRENNVSCDALDNGQLDGSWKWNRDPDGSGNFTNLNSDGIRMSVRNVNPTFSCGGLAGVSMVMPLFDKSSPCSGKFRFDSSAGLYDYAAGSETQFSRCIRVRVSPPEHDTDIPASDQMAITSTVTWQERGVSRELTLTTRLYDWR